MLAASLCAFGSACGASRVIVWSHEIYSIASGLRLDCYGVPVLYKMEDAVIEMQNYCDTGMVVIPDYSIVKNSDKYSYYSEPSSPEDINGGTKQLLYGETLFYEGSPRFDYDLFQWKPVCGFWDNAAKGVVDYVSFISRRNDEIAGYAIVYFWVEEDYAYGKVLADKEVSNTSEEVVREKIQKVIENHKR